ncbi:hypothetical protein Tco_0344565 [Tanacetum coccineum]
MIDSKGFIPLITPTQALKSIQVIADHSRNWYDGATTRERIDGSLDNVDMKKLNENIHAFQESCKTYKGVHLTEESPLMKEDKVWKFIKNTDLNLRALDTTTKNMQVKADQLTQMVLTNAKDSVKTKTKMGKKDMKEPVPHDFPIVYPYVPPTPFPRHLQEQKGNPFKTRETVSMIHKKKAQEKEGDMDDGWDITVKDVEGIRQILTPTIHTFPNLEIVVQPYRPLGPVRDEAKVLKEEEHDYDIPLLDGVMQPLTPKIIRITPPDDDYVASVTNLILDKHLNEYGKELFDMTGVNENGSLNKKEEFEVTPTRIHVVKRGYEIAPDTRVKSSSLTIITQSKEQCLGESLVLILLLFFNFHFLNGTIGTLHKPSGGMGVELPLGLYLPLIF